MPLILGITRRAQRHRLPGFETGQRPDGPIGAFDFTPETLVASVGGTVRNPV